VAHDWADLVTEGSRATLLSKDGIHPSKAGSRRLADAMVSALERDC
jgi:lysophospholipase L1-like esterase